MKLSILTYVSAVFLVGASMPVHAQSLLDGLLGGAGNTELVTVGSGDADTSGLVNLGVGGNDQLLDVNAGGDLASATVGTGGESGVGACRLPVTVRE